MYQPEHFRPADRAAAFEVMRAHPLGQLVTAGPGGLMANPVPFILHAEEGGDGVLRTHLARPNAQWREIEAGADLLVIFQGPQAYVTPGWYATKQEHGKVVPTWNYVVVQVRGRAVTRHDGDWLMAHVALLSDRHEATRATPWAVSDAPDGFIAALTRGIVGVEIAITAVDAKFKMSQNRPAVDRDGVAQGFDSLGANDVAALVRELGAGRT